MNVAKLRIIQNIGLFWLGLIMICLMISSSKPASASMAPGFYDYGRSGVIVMYSGDARGFGDLLAQTNKTQDTLNRLAGYLIRYMPARTAWNFARYICYNGINTAVRNRIYWCSYRSDRVYIYTWYGISNCPEIGYN